MSPNNFSFSATKDKKQTQPAAENDFDSSLIMVRNEDCNLDSFNDLSNPSDNCNSKVEVVTLEKNGDNLKNNFKEYIDKIWDESESDD